MTEKATVDKSGSVLLPQSLRDELGVQPGDDVVIDIVDGTLRIRTVQSAIREAQRRLRRHVPPGVSLADELIADRKAEAERSRHAKGMSS